MDSGYKKCIWSARNYNLEFESRNNHIHSLSSFNNGYKEPWAVTVGDWKRPKFKNGGNGNSSFCVGALGLKRSYIEGSYIQSSSFTRSRKKISNLNRKPPLSINSRSEFSKMSYRSNCSPSRISTEGGRMPNQGNDEPVFYKTPSRVSKFSYEPCSSKSNANYSNDSLPGPEDSKSSMIKYSRFSYKPPEARQSGRDISKRSYSRPSSPLPFGPCVTSYKRRGRSLSPGGLSDPCVTCFITEAKYGKKKKGKYKPPKKKKQKKTKSKTSTTKERRYFPVFKRKGCNKGKGYTVFAKKDPCKVKKTKSKSKSKSKKTKKKDKGKKKEKGKKHSNITCFCE